MYTASTPSLTTGCMRTADTTAVVDTLYRRRIIDEYGLVGGTDTGR
jgi:hypothetical protein